MLIDCHTHAFAPRIASRAVQHLIDYYGLQTDRGGSLQDLLKTASGAGLDALVLLNAATKPDQVQPANDWLIRLADGGAPGTGSPVHPAPRVIPFGTFHIDSPNWLSEVRRLRAAGIRGIKIHPEFQRMDLADPRLNDFWAEVEDDFILMIHIGDLVKRESNLSTPHKLAVVLDRFPKLRAIAAHLGGYTFLQEACRSLARRNVYLDTSSTLPYIDPSVLRAILTRHSRELILFGSDYPLRTPQQDLPLLDAIPWLSDDDRERICGKNAARLLEIPQSIPSGHEVLAGGTGPGTMPGKNSIPFGSL